MAVEQKALNTTQNIRTHEQFKAKNDVLLSVKNYTNRLKDKQKAELINQLAPKVLNAMQKERIDMRDIKNSKIN